MSVRATVTDTVIEEVSAPEGERRPRLVGGLDRGLPNHWFPVMRSSDLRTVPVRVKRFGEDLAVWRDSAGHPHIFQDRCPHRGASLSLGKIRGEALSCWYHGWTYDRSGACTQIPLEDESSNLPGRTRVQTYLAEDRGGYIWAFYGDPAQATPLSISPYELEDPRWSVYRQEYVWKTNWLNILDNVLDPLHALFVHVGVYTQRRRAKFTKFEIADDFEEGFRLAKLGVLVSGETGQEGQVEFLLPAILRLDLADGTPQGMMRVVMMPTPIDEHSTFLCYIQARRVSGLARLWWHILWWTKLRPAQNMIKAQDSLLLSSLGPIVETRLHEHLADSDLGVIHLRRRLNRAFARSQAPAGQPREQHAAAPHSTRARRVFAAWELESEKTGCRSGTKS